MNKIQTRHLLIGLAMLLSSSVRADVPTDLGMLTTSAPITFAGEIDTANQVDDYTFTVPNTESVELYTASDSPFDPRLTLWESMGSDWQLLTTNDNRAMPNFFETQNGKDAQIFSQLMAGTYLVSVSESGNAANGMVLSAGFSNGGQQSNSYYMYELNLSAVPEPSSLAVWMLGSALMGFLRVSKQKGLI